MINVLWDIILISGGGNFSLEVAAPAEAEVKFTIPSIGFSCIGEYHEGKFYFVIPEDLGEVPAEADYTITVEDNIISRGRCYFDLLVSDIAAEMKLDTEFAGVISVNGKTGVVDLGSVPTTVGFIKIGE